MSLLMGELDSIARCAAQYLSLIHILNGFSLRAYAP